MLSVRISFNKKSLILFKGFLFGAILQLSAASIVLNNGKVLKDAQVVGESANTVIIEHAEGVDSYPRRLVPKKYWTDDAAEMMKATLTPQATETQRPASASNNTAIGAGDTYGTPPLPANAGQRQKSDADRATAAMDSPSGNASSTAAPLGGFFNYYRETNRANSTALVSLVQELPRRWVWFMGAAGVIIISIGILIAAIFFRIFAAILRLPMRTFAKCYRVLWLSGIIGFIAFIVAAIYAPVVVEWPWTGLLISLVLGLVFMLLVFGMTPLHAAVTYLLFWIIATGINVGLAYVAYAGGQPIQNAEQLEAISQFLRDKAAGDADTESS